MSRTPNLGALLVLRPSGRRAQGHVRGRGCQHPEAAAVPEVPLGKMFALRIDAFVCLARPSTKAEPLHRTPWKCAGQLLGLR